MAQTAVIESIGVVSEPTGGAAATRATAPDVYIIGDTVTFKVTYNATLGNVGAPILDITVGTASKGATCAAAPGDATSLLCSYEIAELDVAAAGTGTGQGVRVTGLRANTGTLPTYENPADANITHETRQVDGIRLSISDVATEATQGTPDTGSGYKTGDKIGLSVEFTDGDTTVVLPTKSTGFGMALVLDSAERNATRVNSSVATELRFEYTAVAGDNARAFTLKLSGEGGLEDVNGNSGLATLNNVNAATVLKSTAVRRVDTRGPRVAQISIVDDPITFRASPTDGSDGATPAESRITFEVQFDEKVAATGVSLVVNIGTATTTAGCDDVSDGNEAFKLTCNASVAAGWEDTDGVSTPANPLRFGQGGLVDDLDNSALPTFAAQRFPNHKVDAVPPRVTRVSLSVPQAKENNNVVVTMTFSEPVTVASTRPSVTLTIEDGDSTAGNATYARQTSSTALEFRYSLIGTDVDDFDTAVSANNNKAVTLTASFAATGAVMDAAGNDANPSVADLPANTKAGTLRLIAAAGDNTRPTLTSITLVAPPEGGRYGAEAPNNSITLEALFSEPVEVAGDAKPFILIGTTRVDATRVTHSTTGVSATHTFSFTTATGDNGRVTVRGISLPASATVLDRESNHDNDDGTTPLTRRGWENAETVVAGRTKTDLISKSLSGSATIDTTPPKITQVRLLASPAPEIEGPDGAMYYGENHKIRIQVTMDEDVKVTGDGPTLQLAVGSDTPNAIFETMTGKRDLYFEYTVLEAHEDRDGVEVTGITNTPDGDRLEDLAGNDCATNCGFDGWAGTRSASHLVDGDLKGDQSVRPVTDPSTQPQTVNPVGTPVVRSSTPTGGYYKTGDTITIEVPLSPPVTFTSAPQLLLNFDEGGSQRLTANERISSNGTPLPRLTFSYTVRSGDEDVDGFTGTLSGGGTLTVESGQRVTLGSITVSGIRVDALAPELESLEITSSAGADGTYVAGDNIEITAEFSEDVERQGTADPSLPILVGDSTKTATLQSPSSTAGGDTWVFRYTVVAGDSDDDGVSIAANALEGELEDAAGNEASITHAAVAASTAHRVDTQGPRVTGVAVSGAGDDNLFVEGDTITATVTFDEEVDVATSGSNAVRVRFNIGTTPRTATYAGGDDTTTLTFTYEVVAGDSGMISIPANALEGEAEDDAGNPAGGTPAVPVTPYIVDASAPMLVGAPSITSSPASGDTYVAGEMITVEVGFDEPVVVTGTPRVYLTVGPNRRAASFTGTSTSGADLRFSYTVRAGDMDDNGVSIAANELKLTSGATIQDRNGLSVASSEGTVMHPAVANQSGHKVDAVAPMVESLAITSSPASGDAYLIDETIEVTVTFNEDVTTEGSPMLGIMIGTGTRDASCAQSGGRTELMCSYTVAANDFDADGVSVNADSLSGTITDVPGNPATLTHDALADDPDHKVYAAAPEAVRTIATLSMAAGGATNSLDLGGIFTGFQLTYSASSSDTNVAVATVAGSELTVASGMEGTATVTVTATNLAGSASTTFGVIVATDPVEKAVLNDALAAIGRSMLSSTANVISSRFELAATSSQMALGGSRFGGTLSPEMQRFLAGNDPFAMQERMSERALFSGSGAQQAYGGGYGLTADRLFTGTAFSMPLNAVGTGDAQFAIWGAGDLQSFEGEPDDGMYDGSSSSGYIGVDARGDGWLAGVSVSRSGAEADYDFDNQGRTGVMGGGTLETAVTAFHPYARLEVGPDSEIWVIGGFGGGEADLSRTHVRGTQSSDLSMAMAVGGLRRALAMEFGGADLSLRGDAGFLSLETDSGMMAIDGLSASVSRLRLGLEAAWEGESATPFVEVSGRFDGGDGQTGGGLELAGGLRILSAESGFGLEAKGRVLAMHTGEGYSESGISVTASFEPGAAGRGITFRLSPRWGGSADSTDLFWDEVGNVRDASQYAYGLDRAQTWGVDAALGYGFGLRSMPGIVTPFGQMDVTGAQDQRLRVGVRYGLMQGLLGGTQVELSAERVDGEMYPVGETRVLMSGRARF